MHIEKFMKSRGLKSGPRVFLAKDISKKMLANACESYGVAFDLDKLICLIDETLFSSGKDGCIVGIEGIAFKEMFQSPRYFKFKGLQKFEYLDKIVSVNDGGFAYKFNLADDLHISGVLNAVSEWVKYVNTQEVVKPDASKILKVKEGFDELKIELRSIFSFVVEATADAEEDEEELIADGINTCIDEMNSLEEAIDTDNISLAQITYIESVHSLVVNFLDFIENPLEKSFDLNDFVDSRLHGSVGDFLKGFVKPIVVAVQDQAAKELRQKKLSNFIQASPVDSEKSARNIRRRISVDASEAFFLAGKTFVQLGGVGRASYHFDAVDEVYINYSKIPPSVTLDDESEFPKRKYFSNIEFDRDKAIFRGVIDWSEPEDTTCNGALFWHYEMHFSENFKTISGGQVRSIDEDGDEIDIDYFGKDLLYIST